MSSILDYIPARLHRNKMIDLVLKIKELQDDKNLPTKVFAKNTGVTPQTLYDYFSGKTQISLKNLMKIANFFEVPVGYFFGENETKKITGNNSNVNISSPGAGQSINSSSDVSKICAEYIKEISHLKELLAEKERMIELLMKMHK